MTLQLSNATLGRFVHPLLLLAEMRAAQADAQSLPAPSATRTERASGRVKGIPAVTRAREVDGRWTLELRSLEGDTLLAEMEAERLFAFRDGVVAALSVDAHARPDAKNVALLGGSVNAGVLLKTVRLVRSLRELHVYDADIIRAVELSARLYQELSLPAKSSATLEEALEGSDIVLVAAPLPSPVVLPDGVRATFVEEEVKPFHDLVAAWHVYQTAREDESIPRG